MVLRLHWIPQTSSASCLHPHVQINKSALYDSFESIKPDRTKIGMLAVFLTIAYVWFFVLTLVNLLIQFYVICLLVYFYFKFTQTTKKHSNVT